jgi:hypothetical protein
MDPYRIIGHLQGRISCLSVDARHDTAEQISAELKKLADMSLDELSKEIKAMEAK